LPTGMDSPCCVGVVRDSEGLVGKEITVGKTVKAYYTAPKAKSGKRMGIVVVHDIFGVNLPNPRYVADFLASKGFDAVVPDFFAGHDVTPWPATETEVTEPLEGDAFSTWFSSITNEEYWAKFSAEVDDCTAFLRRKGCVRFGLVGFCWGGRAVEVAAENGRFAAAVSIHGVMHSAETYKAVKCPIEYLTINDDQFFPKDAQDSIIAAGGKLKIFEGVGHGFAVRGDFTDDKVKAAADEALNDAVALCEKACLRKPKMMKIASLNPGSKGVNAVVKILGEPVEVGEGAAAFYEVKCGDETGQVVLSLKEAQKEGLSKDKVITVRNGAIKMVKCYMRLVVDKWGKLDLAAGGEIAEVGQRNLSVTEYELVGA